MDKQQAQKLDQEIRESLVVTADKIEQFILGYCWKYLDYNSLPEWVESLSDIQLSRPVITIIACKLMDEGMLDEDIALALRGVGPSSVASMRREHKAGVPPQVITGLTRKRQPTDVPQILTVVEWRTRTEKDSIAKVAKAAGFTLAEYLRRIALASIQIDA